MFILCFLGSPYFRYICFNCLISNLIELIKRFNQLFKVLFDVSSIYFRVPKYLYITYVINITMVTSTKNNQDEKEVQRVSSDTVQYVESMRLSKYEPFYAIMDRVIDKAKALDKLKKRGE